MHAKWQEFWDSTKQEWFKVEVLQDYTGEDDGSSLQAWKAGEKEKSLALTLNKDLSWAKSKLYINKTRIHIVEEPFTEYLKWEIEHYRHVNIPIGREKVFLVDKKNIYELAIPDGDFCIFDNKKVVKNTYNKTGKCIRMNFYDESDDISLFLNLKNKLLEFAQPVK